MHVPYEVPRISVSDAALAAADVDLIIIPIAQDHAAAAVSRYAGALGDELRSALERGEFKAQASEIFVARAAEWHASRVVFVGGGARSQIGPEQFRRMAASAAQAARQQKRARIGWADLEPGTIETGARIETVAEALVLANF